MFTSVPVKMSPMGMRDRIDEGTLWQVVCAALIIIVVGLWGLLLTDGLGPWWRLFSALIVILGIANLVLAWSRIRRS